MSRRYPFFDSPDDLTALTELACVFGTTRMIDAARSLGTCERTTEACVECAAPRPLTEGPVGRLRRTAVTDKQLMFGEPILAADLRELCEQLNQSCVPPFPDTAYDLLRKCLALDPTQRISAEDAMNHAFFTDSA